MGGWKRTGDWHQAEAGASTSMEAPAIPSGFSGLYSLYHNLKLHVLQPDLHLLHPHPELHLPHPQPELHPQLPVDAAEAVRPAAWAAVLATGDWLHWLLA